MFGFRQREEISRGYKCSRRGTRFSSWAVIGTPAHLRPPPPILRRLNPRMSPTTTALHEKFSSPPIMSKSRPGDSTCKTVWRQETPIATGVGDEPRQQYRHHAAFSVSKRDSAPLWKRRACRYSRGQSIRNTTAAERQGPVSDRRR